MPMSIAFNVSYKQIFQGSEKETTRCIMKPKESTHASYSSDGQGYDNLLASNIVKFINETPQLSEKLNEDKRQSLDNGFLVVDENGYFKTDFGLEISCSRLDADGKVRAINEGLEGVKVVLKGLVDSAEYVKDENGHVKSLKVVLKD